MANKEKFPAERTYIRCTITCPECGGEMIADNYMKCNPKDSGKYKSIKLVDFNISEYEGTVYACSKCENKIEVKFVDLVTTNVSNEDTTNTTEKDKDKNKGE